MRIKSTADFSAEQREYGFRLAFLAPAGYFLLEKCFPLWERLFFDFQRPAHRRVRNQVAELCRQQQVEVFYEVHVVQKIVLILAALVFTGVAALGGGDYSFIFVGLVLAALLCWQTDRELDKKLQARRREMLIDLPEFLHTLTLLVNAGLPLAAAMQKVTREGDPAQPLYRELAGLLTEVETGKPVDQAYEDLAVRCRLLEIRRFVSTILQTQHRGSADLVQVLKILGREAWEQRKDTARRIGEEAATKMVFPMVAVFFAIAIIVLAPAIITMGK